MLEATNDKLRSDVVTEPAMRWLISAARRGGETFTYSDMMERLERECGLEKISSPSGNFARAVGVVLGAVMDKIDDVEDSAPFLNVLVVRKGTGRPGPGAREFLAARYPDELWLKKKDAHKESKAWVRIVEQETEAVRAYPDWERLYGDIYGKAYEPPEPFHIEGTETDGLSWGRKGEGENHKALRLWVKDNPDRIERSLSSVRAETEVELLSGDRVDVVFCSDKEIVAIEVKSRDSNWADLRRGIYQCVKYEAVLRAQETRDRSVRSLLVTEKVLQPDLKRLAKKLDVKHRIVPLT